MEPHCHQFSFRRRLVPAVGAQVRGRDCVLSGDGLDLFVNCFGFKLLCQDKPLAVIEREGAKAYLVEDPEFAAKDRPELTIETDSIDQLYEEISARTPEMLHPNSNKGEKKALGVTRVRGAR